MSKMPKTTSTPLAAVIAALITLTLAACVQSPRPGAAAPTPTSAPTASVQIYRADGARQCEPDSGQSLEAMQAQALGGITVLAARKGVLPGRVFPAVCGGMTGSVNIYTIAERDWERAQTRGFQRWTE